MTILGEALRKKYRTPREAMRALGLDENLINGDRSMSTNTVLAKTMNAIAHRQTSIGALVTYLRPRLAMDAKIDLAKAFDGVTGKTFKEKKPVIAASIRDQAKGKIAKDASLDDVEKVLDMLDGHEVDGGDESVSEAQHKAMEAAAHGQSTLGIPEKVGKEFAAKDASEGIKNFLKEKGMADDDINSVMGMMPQPAADESEEEKKKREKEEADKKAATDKAAKDAEMDKENDKDKVTKPAMDAAINAAVDATAKRVRDTERGIRAALADVRPWVGELNPALAFDSAADVHRHAAKSMGIEGAADIHESALLTIIRMHPKPGARPMHDRRLGMDSASAKDFSSRFPGTDRIGVA